MNFMETSITQRLKISSPIRADQSIAKAERDRMPAANPCIASTLQFGAAASGVAGHLVDRSGLKDKSHVQLRGARRYNPAGIILSSDRVPSTDGSFVARTQRNSLVPLEMPQ